MSNMNTEQIQDTIQAFVVSGCNLTKTRKLQSVWFESTLVPRRLHILVLLHIYYKFRYFGGARSVTCYW